MKIHKQTVIISSILLVFLALITTELHIHAIYQLIGGFTYPVAWESLLQNMSIGLTASIIILLMTSILGYCIEKRKAKITVYRNSVYLYVESDLIGVLFNFNALLRKKDTEIVSEIENNGELFEKVENWMSFYQITWMPDNSLYTPFFKQSFEYKTIFKLQQEIAKISIAMDGMKLLYLNKRSKIKGFDKDGTKEKTLTILRDGSIDNNIHSLLDELEQKLLIVRYTFNDIHKKENNSQK